MNEVINQMFKHRSIRKYKNRDIDQKILDQILRAATCASTSGNMQAYSIIVTRSRQMKERMFKAHFEQPMLMEAPVFVTFCADFNRMRKWVKLNKAANNFDNFMSFMIASIDSILASQNAVLAAESLGLGVCYMGTTLASSKEIGEVLKLPENVVPIVGFSLGYPDEVPIERKRLPMDSIIHSETYKDYSNEDLEEIYFEKNIEGMRRYENITELKNLAQVYTEFKYTEESHLKYSKDLLTYLINQNFM